MTYTVEISDVADAEIQATFLRLAAHDPEFAGRWLEGLLRAIQTLEVFPLRYARAPESDTLRQEIRGMLYQSGRMTYRVLFSIVDAAGNGAPESVRVLRVLHGAQRPLGSQDEENSEESS